MEAVFCYKLQKESNCQNLCRQCPLSRIPEKRCHFCCTDLAGPQKKKKKADMSLFKAQCQACGESFCSIHAIVSVNKICPNDTLPSK